MIPAHRPTKRDSAALLDSGTDCFLFVLLHQIARGLGGQQAGPKCRDTVSITLPASLSRTPIVLGISLYVGQ